MTSSAVPVVRSDLIEGITLVPLERLRRYEVTPPRLEGEIRGISEAVGCTHGRRASITAHVGGGHLRGTKEDLLHRVLEEAAERLDATLTRTATEQIHGLVSWLEDERASGFLDRAYITATIVLAVSDDEVCTWLVSPHGLAHGTPERIRFISTDLRYPVLRRLGLLKEPAFRFPGAEAGDQASSIMCIGASNGYETILTRLAEADIVVALDRGALPFGPLPTEPVPLGSLWEMDAAWKHGLAGCALVFGHASTIDLRLPLGWQVREVALRS